MVSDMGFTTAQAKKALKETVCTYFVIHEVSSAETLAFRGTMSNVQSTGFSTTPTTMVKRCLVVPRLPVNKRLADYPWRNLPIIA